MCYRCEEHFETKALLLRFPSANPWWHHLTCQTSTAGHIFNFLSRFITSSAALMWGSYTKLKESRSKGSNLEPQEALARLAILSDESFWFTAALKNSDKWCELGLEELEQWKKTLWTSWEGDGWCSFALCASSRASAKKQELFFHV